MSFQKVKRLSPFRTLYKDNSGSGIAVIKNERTNIVYSPHKFINMYTGYRNYDERYVQRMGGMASTVNQLYVDIDGIRFFPEKKGVLNDNEQEAFQYCNCSVCRAAKDTERNLFRR